ncbi:MAG: dockerin type I domain-containing protein [Chloroflexia bacterium]
MSRKLMGAGATVLLGLSLLVPFASAATIDPSPGGLPVLHVQMHFEGRDQVPDSTQIQKVHYVVGNPNDDTYTLEGTTITDKYGHFALNVASLRPNKYLLWVKSSKYLANRVTVDLTEGNVFNADSGLLRAGDANDDNVVNSTDLGILKKTFGKAVGEDNYDDRANFNGDKIVDDTDLAMLKDNFGTSGDVAP